MYSINVSFKGQHIFATTKIDPMFIRVVHDLLHISMPESYKLTVHKHVEYCEEVEL